MNKDDTVSTAKTKKPLKLNIIMAIVLSAGILLGIFGYALGGTRAVIFGERGFSIVKSEQIRVDERGLSFGKINVDVKAARVELIRADRFAYEISSGSHQTYTHNISDGELSIKETTKSGFRFFSFGIHVPDLEIKIYYNKPLDDVFVHTSAGKITVNGLESNALDLDISAGNMEVNDCQIKGVTHAKSSAGAVTVENCKSREFKLENQAGKIVLDNCSAKVTDIKSSTGGVKLSDTSSESFKIKTTAGAVNAQDIRSKGLTADVTTGSVKISGALTGRTAVDVSAGSTTINVYGDSANTNVSLASSAGICRINGEKRNFLEPSGANAGNSIRVTSTTGSVNVNFSNDFHDGFDDDFDDDFDDYFDDYFDDDTEFID
ncbi:MAG: DUF4097 domain-containing protein [Oscillospiraceae bacterium]|jgi:DUF4097 and DUF4098 domain-containing protein YvlB|nr:DUF4097 domain-containing protein [Oscillospiraceae bacterium]